MKGIVNSMKEELDKLVGISAEDKFIIVKLRNSIKELSAIAEGKKVSFSGVDSESRYYDKGGIETIDIIAAKLTEEQFDGFLLGSALAYLCRCNFKHDDKARDVEKAQVYLKWLSESCKPKKE